MKNNIFRSINELIFNKKFYNYSTRGINKIHLTTVRTN